MPLFDLFWSMLWFFLFIMWIFLVFRVFTDIFRSDMSGWAKAAWVVVVLVIPLLGVLVYVIANGGAMARRDAESAQAIEQAQRDYIRSVAGSGGASSAEELAKLAQLRDQGVLTEAEFEAQKAKLLGI